MESGHDDSEDVRIDLTDLPEPPSNLLDQLADKRKHLSDVQEVDIRIPGYDQEPPLLFARYRLLESRELAQIGLRVREITRDKIERQELSFVDTFIKACRGFYVDLGDGKLQPLTINGDHIRTFNSDLATALRYADKIHDPSRPRDVVYGLFVNPNAILDHGFRLMTWFTNTGLSVDEDLFLGNL